MATTADKSKFLTIDETIAACPFTVSERTIRQWMSVGYPINGERIRLHSFRIGGRRLTTREHLDRFLIRITQS